MTSMMDLTPAVNSPLLDASESRVLARLMQTMQAHQHGNDLRGMYYAGKQTLRMAGKMGMSLPPSLGKLETVLGWPAKAVTTLEQRLDVLGFVGNDESDSIISEIAADNDLTTLQSMTHTAALIHGSAFVTVSAGDESAGEPPVVISARSAREATAIYSTRSRKITAGLTVNNDPGSPIQVVLWLPEWVTTMTKEVDGWRVERQAHRLGRVPMERMTFRPHLEQQFGVPRITDEVMGLTDSAMRTVLRMEGTAEFFSFPQRWAIGLAESDVGETFKTYLNRFLMIGPAEEGDQAPQFGEFRSSSPEPHIAQLRSIAGMFSGATSIPLNYLGIVHDNPSSADAIRAAEADLVTVAERAQRNFGASWASVMRMAHFAAVGDEDPALRSLITRWRDASTPTKAAQSQSIVQQVTMGVLPAQDPVTWELLGYDEATIRRLTQAVEKQRAHETLTGILDKRSAAPGIRQEATELMETETG
ncbi:phage portal protein [Corynebacterium antarcticum]|uniref:phage portal protein n=1 Tax=Corynebacterium antarcticum TaxID=2800405 RepID=UPI002002A15B|nr:phage portal protein [Corynebacterium antarcticum]MCK7661978.1 phage portal protein [Corynebacterium antarcticum]